MNTYRAYFLRLALLAIALSAVASGCVPWTPHAPTATWHPREPNARCSSQQRSRPDVQEWNARDRAALESGLDKGRTIVVSALGCEVEVLPRCYAPGRYEFAAVAPLVERDDDARKTIVGRYDLDVAEVAAGELRGSCDNATHIVAGATVGASTAIDPSAPAATDRAPRTSRRRVVPLQAELAKLSLGSFRVTGKWRGVMRQAGGPYDSYEIELSVVQQGDRVTGVSTLETVDGEYWGELHFEGRLEGNVLLFADLRVMDHNLPFMYEWCSKQGYLIIDPKELRMAGQWRAFGCSGTTTMQKLGEAKPAQLVQAAAR